METVTLQGKDFRTVHNTLCELRALQEQLTGVISDSIAGRLHSVIKGFEAGLADAYAQDNNVFDLKMDYYSEFKADNKLASIWSMFELPVHGFLQPHPYPSDAFIVYTQHWGEGNKDKHYPVLGSTWGDVYRAADLAVRESGDSHHVFIEGFEVKGNELHMSTGS
jgi:hypothetical protein